jgi:hypothetical protein
MHYKLSPSTISVDLKGVPGHLSQILTSTTTQKCHYVEPTFIQQSLWCARIECNTIDIIKVYKVLLANSWLIFELMKSKNSKSTQRAVTRSIELFRDFLIKKMNLENLTSGSAVLILGINTCCYYYHMLQGMGGAYEMLWKTNKCRLSNEVNG